MSHQSRFDARYWMLGAGALGRPRRMVWGGRREEGSGWGTHVYLWRIHFDVWQNQYNSVKFKNKIKLKKKKQLNGQVIEQWMNTSEGGGSLEKCVVSIVLKYVLFCSSDFHHFVFQVNYPFFCLSLLLILFNVLLISICSLVLLGLW